MEPSDSVIPIRMLSPHAVTGARAPPPRRILPRRRLRSPQLWPRGPSPGRGDLRGRADQASRRRERTAGERMWGSEGGFELEVEG